MSKFKVILPKIYSEEFESSRVNVVDVESYIFSVHVLDSSLQSDSDLLSLVKKLVNDGDSAGAIELDRLCPKAVFFDMDATVIREESLVEIAKLAGKEQAVASMTRDAMAGGMDFAQSLTKRVALLNGTSKDVVHSCPHTFMPGFLDFAQFLKSRNIKLFLISGGFLDLVAKVGAQGDFDDWHANQFGWNEDFLDGTVLHPIVDAEGKASAVKAWGQKFGFDLNDCYAIGDGANDLKMLNLVGVPIGMSPKPILWPHIHINVKQGHYEFLKKLME